MPSEEDAEAEALREALAIVLGAESEGAAAPPAVPSARVEPDEDAAEPEPELEPEPEPKPKLESEPEPEPDQEPVPESEPDVMANPLDRLVGHNEIRPAARPLAARKSAEAIPWPSNDRLPVTPGDAAKGTSRSAAPAAPVPAQPPVTEQTEDSETHRKKGLFGRFRGG